MEYLKIKNWEKWQTYRTDRGQPPWIKVHRNLMRNPEWISLTDTERGQLIAIWMLAADKKGSIPASPELIKKLCFMSSEKLNINKFIELGFICQLDANLTPERRQLDANLTPQSRVDKSRVEENRIEKNTCPHEDIVSLWSKILPELVKPSKWDDDDRKLLKARWMYSKNTQTLDWWEEFFTYIRDSPFLMGEVKPQNGRPRFKLRLQWALNKQNFKKIIDGMYHNT